MKNKTVRLATAAGLAAVFVILTVIGGILLGQDSGYPPSEATRGVMFIEAYVTDPLGNLYGGTGSGFAVGKPGEPVQYIVTNGHVVGSAVEIPKAYPSYSPTVRVWFSSAENDFMLAQVVYYSPADEKDIAILKLPSTTTKREALRLRPSDDVFSGETVFALGFPAVSSEFQANVRHDQSDITITSGVISKRLSVSGSTYEAYQFDASISGGNSGGPLVDQKGFVVGINTAGIDTVITQLLPNADNELEFVEAYISQGVNYASIADELMRVLDNERIDYTTKGANTTLAFVLFGVALVALAGAIVLFTRKGVQTSGAAAPQRQAGSKRQADAKAAPSAGSELSLLGVAGAFSSNSFTLRDSLRIGRDKATCQIIFPDSTAGISGNHCEIRVQNGVITLADLGSSYGTFLNDGTKLAPNVPCTLKRGDSFYLASRKTGFKIQ